MGHSNRRILDRRMAYRPICTAGILGALIKHDKRTMRTAHFLAKLRLGLPTEAPNQGTDETKPPNTQNDQIQHRARRRKRRPAPIAQPPPSGMTKTNTEREPTTRANETTANAEQPKPRETQKTKPQPTPSPRSLKKNTLVVTGDPPARGCK